MELPDGGRAFLSVKESDKAGLVPISVANWWIWASIWLQPGAPPRCWKRPAFPSNGYSKVGQGRPDVGDLSEERAD